MAGVEISGIEEAIATISGARDRAADLQPVLAIIAEDTRTLIDDGFVGAISPSGASWQRLAPSTVRRRRRGSFKPLIDTGRLRGSIGTSVGARSLSVGTNVQYGAFHQIGTSKIPARPFLPFEEVGGEWELERRGPAGRHWLEAEDTIRRYIETGELP